MIDLGSLRDAPWVELVGWMLVRSLWQGAAVAAVLAFVLRLLKVASAQARYAAACGAMALLVVLPLAGTHWPMPSTVIATKHPPSVAPAWLLAPNTRLAESAREVVVERLERLFPLVVGLWMAGAFLLYLRLIGGWIVARRWVNRGTRAVNVPGIDQLKNRMGIRGTITLLESSLVDVPMVVGWLRPALILPVATLSGLSAEEFEMILAHELAHIRRHDYLVNLLQCVVEVLVFYHPATWWISRVIRREREHCCDDLAVAVSGDCISYCRALAVLEGLRGGAFCLSQAADGGNLTARVERLLNPKEESMKAVRMPIILTVFLIVAPMWLTRADDRPAGDSPVSGMKSPQPTAAASGDPAGSRTLDDSTNVHVLGPKGVESRKPVAAPALEVDLPPSEEEVWRKVVEAANVRHPGRKVQRDHVSIMIEKIGDKTDAVKFYPLAGPCQMVHRHYKATAHFDEVWKEDGASPATHIANRVEVVYIDKDSLRRVPAKAGDIDLDLRESVDKAVREMEQLKQEVERSGQEQGRKIDQLIKKLKQLKREPVGMNNDAEAEKTFQTGLYYKRTGRLASANFFFGKTRQRWPKSEWAAKSVREELDAHRTGAEGGNAGSFNFAVGGVY